MIFKEWQTKPKKYESSFSCIVVEKVVNDDKVTAAFAFESDADLFVKAVAKEKPDWATRLVVVRIADEDEGGSR